MRNIWEAKKSGGGEQRARIASRGRVLSGVRAHFSAAHRCQQTGQIHGHTWEVVVWFENLSRCDARVLKAQIDNDLARWDHGILPDEFAWAEDIALDLAKRENVVRVEINRPHEGLMAAWERSA